MFAPRGYTAVPQEASQDEDENDNLKRSFDRRMVSAGSRSSTAAMASPKSLRDGEEGDRKIKRNVRFESRSLEDKSEPMSNARRCCFVVSLMVCTLTIFVFAFTVPCKGPSCNVANMITTVTSNLEKFHKNWSVSFSGHSTGIIFHLSSTRSREIVTSYNKNGFNSKKKYQSGLISLREENGQLVWLYNASDVVKLIECRTDNNNIETCLIQSSHGKLQLVNPKSNRIIWSTRILIGSVLPSVIIGVNDCDGDNGRDVLLSYDEFNTTCVTLSTNKTTCTHPGIVQLISGRTGYPLGNRLSIPQSHLIKRVAVHSTRHFENLIFVLTVGNKGHLKVISIQELYRKILAARGDQPIFLFKNSTTSVSDVVSTDHELVVRDLNKDFVEDIIMVTLAGNTHSLTAVDGGRLKKMWRIAFGARKMMSEPVVGHFNDDEIPDILVVLEDPLLSLLNQSLVQILDGQNGNILWSRKLRLAKNTTPLSASIGYKSDVFLLSIETENNRKYQKIFPSKAVKDTPAREARSKEADSFKVHDVQKNISENFINQKVRHHRSPRSVQSSGEKIGDVEVELDSLVDDIYVQHFQKKPTTKPRDEERHLERKKVENTRKLLEDILKNEKETSGRVKEESSSVGKPKMTTLTTENPDLHYSLTPFARPKSGMKTTIKQVFPNNFDSGFNARKASVGSMSVTEIPKHDNVHITSTKSGTKVSDRDRVAHVSMNGLEDNVYYTKRSHSLTTVATKSPILNGKNNLRTEKPSIKVNEKVITSSSGDTINEKNNDVAKTPAMKTFKTVQDMHGLTKSQKTGMINANTLKKGISYQPGRTSLYRISTLTTKTPNSNSHTATKEPPVETSNKMIGEHVAVYGSKNELNGNSRSTLSQLATEQSLSDNENQDIALKEDKIKTADGQGTKQIIIYDGIIERPKSTVTWAQSRLGTRGKIKASIYPTTRMGDGQSAREIALGIGNDGTIELQKPTVTLVSSRPETRDNIKGISKPTARVLSGGRVSDLLPQIPFSENRKLKSDTVLLGNSHFKEQTSETGTSPTPLLKKHNDIKVSSVNSKNMRSHRYIADTKPTENMTSHSKLKSAMKLESEKDARTETPTVSPNVAIVLTTADQYGGNIHAADVESKNSEDITRELAKDINGSHLSVGANDSTLNASRNVPKVFDGNKYEKKRIEDDTSDAVRNRIFMYENSTLALNFRVNESLTPKGLVKVSAKRNDGVMLLRPSGSVNVLRDKSRRNLPTKVSTLQNSTNEIHNTSFVRNSEKDIAMNSNTMDEHGVMGLSDNSGSNEIPNKRSSFYDRSNVTKVKYTPTELHYQSEKLLINVQSSSDTRQDKDVGIEKSLPSKNSKNRLNLERVSVDLKGRLLSNSKRRGESAEHVERIVKALQPMKLNVSDHLVKNKSAKVEPTSPNPKQSSFKSLLTTNQNEYSERENTPTTTKPRITGGNKKKDAGCTKGSNLALIAIFPNSPRNSFTLISQDDSVTKRKGNTLSNSCHTLWPSFDSSPLAHDADSEGFLEIVYAVNYGSAEQSERTMNVRRFSIKVDSGG